VFEIFLDVKHWRAIKVVFFFENTIHISTIFPFILQLAGLEKICDRGKLVQNVKWGVSDHDRIMLISYLLSRARAQR
jgi:hypothetical protein